MVQFSAVPRAIDNRPYGIYRGAANRPRNIYLTVVPQAGCILPLRLITVVRWVSARPVVAPYGVVRNCKQTDKHLFDFISFLFG